MKLLEIPTPLCEKHQREKIPFKVKTNSGWEYYVIPVQLGSLPCRECIGKLTSADFVDLRGADLRGADLCSVYLVGADLFGADLRGAYLRGVYLCNADLCDANLCGADLVDADLRAANLCAANLCGADLCNADLCGAILCDVQNITLAKNLDKAYWNKFTRIDTVKLNEEYYKYVDE